MPFLFENLDVATRELMKQEIAGDQVAGNVYLSNYLTADGAARWPAALTFSAENGNDATLVAQLRAGRFFKQATERRLASGRTTMAAVPVTAPETLGEGEFNRYYIRALCLRAIAAGNPVVEVYRARASENPRPDSEALIGQRLDATVLLTALRGDPSVDKALGLARPNSRLSVKLV